MIRIKNKQKLLSRCDDESAKKRAMLFDIAEFAIKSVMPEKLLAGKIPNKAVKNADKILVVAIGKAARGMAKACAVQLKGKKYKVLFADKGHPLPTAESIRNTNKIVMAAEQLTKNDLAIVLISGGGSAMFELPIDDVSLNDLIKIYRALIRSGATIDEINVVRKHLSQVKGGGLARILSNTNVLGFVISDVVGNDISTIASGPLSPDPSTLKEALKIIKKYSIKISKKIEDKLLKSENETPKAGDTCFKNVKIEIVGDHQSVAKAALTRAKELKIKAKVEASALVGEAREVAKKFVKKCSVGLTIAWGETTVTCKGSGFGGRNQEFVLSAMEILKPNQIILSIGTDGIDGICPQKIAGAFADKKIIKRAEKNRLKTDEFLKDNDSYTFFNSVDGLIKTGATGTNLGDLVLFYSE